MENITDKLNKLINDTAQFRDELIVQAKLGQYETQEELIELESRFNKLKETCKKLMMVTGDSAESLRVAAELGIHAQSLDELHSALELSAEEIKRGFDRARALL